MKNLRVGVIGVGGIARTHMPGWKQSPHTEVVAASDINAEALAKWGKDHGISKLYQDPIELINDTEIDIVDVCTPNSYHCELTVAALNAGKHVICEKPLAPTASEIEKMIEARDRSGKKLMCAQHFRFKDGSKLIKDQAQFIGPIYHARSWMLRRNAMPVSDGFLIKKHSGGGACIDIGVHVLDLTLWFMGNPEPKSVTGVARTELAKEKGAFSKSGIYNPDNMDVEELAAAFVRFENGAVLMLEVSWMLHHEAGEFEDMQVWLYGKKGGLHWPSLEKLTSDPNSKSDSNSTLKPLSRSVEAHAQECIEFSESIINDQPVPVPAEHSLQVMKILNSVYESQQTGKEVIL